MSNIMIDKSLPRPTDRFIPWYIVLFFLVLTVVFGGFVYIAEKTYTGVVTEEAYDKGLAYNQTIEKAQEQAALGFTAAVTHQGNKISFSLTDRNGKPVTGAAVTLGLFRPVQAGMDQSIAMTPENDHYAATVTLPAPGLWELRIHAVTPKGPYQTTKRIVFE